MNTLILLEKIKTLEIILATHKEHTLFKLPPVSTMIGLLETGVADIKQEVENAKE